MSSIFSKEFLGNRLIVGALGLVVVIAAASSIYYYAATRVPQGAAAVSTATSTAQTVTATGTIEPAQNPDLAFISGGRVVRLSATVGQKVGQGQLLASLDTASLSAQRAQAAANLASAQANLDEMQAGPRQVDVQAKQTAVSQAQTTLSNLYGSIPAAVAQAYDKSFSGVSGSTDNLFNQPNSPNPSLLFSTTNSQLSTNAVNDRAMAESELSAWQTEVNALSAASSPATIDAGITSAIAHLGVLRTYNDALLQALANAIPASNFSSAQAAAAQTAVGALRDTINGQIISLQTQQQQIASDKLAVQSAQDALNQVLAGSTPQDIEAQQAQVAAAQASVQNFNAQIANATIVAPFAGTVSSVSVKLGDTVAPGTVGVSLNPESALQVTSYFSEIDAAKLRAGMQAQVTTDAYGNARIFPATVITVDTSPTPGTNGAPSPGYEVTLQFAQADAALSSGMTANVTISLNQ